MINGNKTCSKFEVIRSLGCFLEEKIPALLKPIEESCGSRVIFYPVCKMIDKIR